MRRTSKFVRPVVSREVYTQKAIQTAWPSGSWVDETPELEGASDGEAGADVGSQLAPPPSSITIIGGTKYDELELERYLSELPPDTVIITGVGRGAESSLEDVTRVFNGDLPRKYNVESVLSYHLTSPLLLVGEGERVKQAKSWLKRANWGREVTELP